MKLSIFSAITLIVVVAASLASAHTFRLHREPHSYRKYAPGEKRLSREHMDRKTAGNTIPMSGGVVTTNAFFIAMTMGTGAGQTTFKTVVDTGSSNTEVPAVGCVNCQNSANVYYNASASPTAKALGCEDPVCLNCVPMDTPNSPINLEEHLRDLFASQQQEGASSSYVKKEKSLQWKCPYGPAVCREKKCGWQVTYGGGGSMSWGNYVRDQACFPTADGKSLCGNAYIGQLLNQGPASSLSQGILGLAYPKNGCNPTCVPPIVDDFVSQGAVTNNTFGMCLTQKDGGVLDMGYTNSSRYHGSLVYTPVVKKHWFNIEVTDFLVDGVSVGMPPFAYAITNDVIGSFVDSGTTLVLVGPMTFQKLATMMTTGQYATLPHVQSLFQGNEVMESNRTKFDAYPQMSFVVSGMPGQPSFHVSMGPREYIMDVGSGFFALGIAGIPSIGAILGDVIMQNYYIEFDRYNGKLGFAKVKNCAAF